MIKNMLEKRLLFCEKEIKRLNKLLEKSPEGLLSCVKNNQSYKWYLNSPEHSHRKLISRKESDFAEVLAAKTYHFFLLNDYMREIKALRRCLENCICESSRSSKYINNPEVSRLLSSQYKPQNKELAEWASADYPINKNYPETLTVKCASGRMVRSKSEAIIEMMLLQYNIPFRYEDQLIIEGHVYFPDFIIRHPVTGEYFIWEHLGLMGDSKYRAQTYAKLNAYGRIGYYPNINLIITSETENHPLDIEFVQLMIQHYFL